MRKIRQKRLEEELRKVPEPVKMQSFVTQNQDSEVYLEKIRSRRKNRIQRWVSAVFTLLFGGMSAAYAFLPQFRFNDIEITGMDKINKAEIVYFTGAKGQPVFTVDPVQIRATLLQHYQDIYDAEVTIDFPSQMM